MAGLTLEDAKEHSLSTEEWALIHEILGRAPNRVELGIFSVMWSEHCSYKSSKHWLKTLPTAGPRVICGPGENAGVVDIGAGLAAVFKMESHNHPSFIEPYQGAATGVGGILRDVFTMGARPVALLDSLRFGALEHGKTRHLLSGVVAGIGGYGNCIGVPTVGGETTFHPAYNGNILVNVMCVGIAETEKIFYSAAAGIGNPVVYIGAKTGRDGIHGATMASAEFGAGAEEKRPTVQVGDPFTEKLLLEACLELMQQDSIVAIQDMGAAGLTSSSFEMAAKGGLGIEMTLDAVPMRETGMTPYEIMLSESQERMLLVLKAGREAQAEAVMRKWGLDVAVVGRLTDSGRMVLRWQGEVVADVPIPPVSSAAPEYQRPYTEPRPALPLAAENVPNFVSHDQALLALIGCADICSKAWLWTHYDHMVMADTVLRPGAGDSAVIRVHGTARALALTSDVTPRYCASDPKQGGRQAVAEAYRNLSAVGAEPLALTNCLNFGNPERPAVMGQFVGCVTGMAEACRALDFPVVSGNVSLYNETAGRAISPTPTIGGLGLLDDVRRCARLALPDDGLVLVLLGECFGWLGNSLYLRELGGSEAGAPPPVAFEAERRHGACVRALIRDQLIVACHDVSDGGLAVAVAEMCLAGGIGATLTLPEGYIALAAWWFGEDQARYVVAAAPDQAATVLRRAQDAGVIARRIGTSGGDALTLGDAAPIALDVLRTTHTRPIPEFIDAQPV